jgi:hypothetical protein
MSSGSRGDQPSLRLLDLVFCLPDLPSGLMDVLAHLRKILRTLFRAFR